MNYNRELKRKITLTPKIEGEGNTTNYGSLIADIPDLGSLVYQFYLPESVHPPYLSSSNVIIGDPTGFLQEIKQDSFLLPLALDGNNAIAAPNRLMFLNSKVLISEISINIINILGGTVNEDRILTYYTYNLSGILTEQKINTAEFRRNNIVDKGLIVFKKKLILSNCHALSYPIFENEGILISLQPLSFID